MAGQYEHGRRLDPIVLPEAEVGREHGRFRRDDRHGQRVRDRRREVDRIAAVPLCRSLDDSDLRLC